VFSISFANAQKSAETIRLEKLNLKPIKSIVDEQIGKIDNETRALRVNRNESFKPETLEEANASNVGYSQGDVSSDLAEVDNNSEVLVSAFPNPGNDRFCIQVKNAENIDNIEVLNIQGVTVYKTTNEPYNEMLIDITNQPTGTYLVNVSLEGKIQTTKIIKK
jgi:hypothetical protein